MLTVSTTVYINIKKGVVIMNIMTKTRTKLSQLSGKILDSKAYKTAERVAIGASSGLAALGVSAMNSSAVDWGAAISAETAIGYISENAADFIEPAIIIMCAVSGLRLGMRFLRGSAK